MAGNSYNRRDFIHTLLGGLAAGTTLISCQRDSAGGLPTRPLGKTGERVSILCLGGWDVAAAESEEESIRLMHEALDNGLFFWDNCWEYHNGRAEEIMGRAMAQSSVRDKVFLMTKVCNRTYEGARQYLEDSLRRLQTDRIDLWQFHAIQWEKDAETILDYENGAIRAALEAKKEGKVRYIGFTGHKHPSYHLAMLGQDFEWDAVQLPTNILDPHYVSFQKEVIPVCNSRDIGVLGMKSLAAQRGRIPAETGVEPSLCRRYALSLPISSLVIGIQNRVELQSDLALARDFKPLTETEISDLLDLSESYALDGAIEVYKSTNWGRCGWLQTNAPLG